jgi:hypothetical protein
MVQQVILPIFEKRSNFFSKFIVTLFIIGLIGVLLNIVFWKSIFLSNFIVGLILLSGFIMGLINNDIRVGTIILTESEIRINNFEIISIQDVQDFKILINGYEGRRGLHNVRSFYADEGKNNYLEFESNNTHYKFRFLVSSKNYEALINLKKVLENQNPWQ